SLFLKSRNRYFLLKTISFEEKETLIQIARSYRDYLHSNPNTLIQKIYGLFSYKSSFLPFSSHIYFLVFGNILFVPPKNKNNNNKNLNRLSLPLMTEENEEEEEEEEKLELKAVFDLKGSTNNRMDKKGSGVLLDLDLKRNFALNEKIRNELLKQLE